MEFLVPIIDICCLSARYLGHKKPDLIVQHGTKHQKSRVNKNGDECWDRNLQYMYQDLSRD